jgi:hypothetical protein
MNRSPMNGVSAITSSSSDELRRMPLLRLPLTPNVALSPSEDLAGIVEASSGQPLEAWRSASKVRKVGSAARRARGGIAGLHAMTCGSSDDV